MFKAMPDDTSATAGGTPVDKKGLETTGWSPSAPGQNLEVSTGAAEPDVFGIRLSMSGTALITINFVSKNPENVSHVCIRINFLMKLRDAVTNSCKPRAKRPSLSTFASGRGKRI